MILLAIPGISFAAAGVAALVARGASARIVTLVSALFTCTLTMLAAGMTDSLGRITAVPDWIGVNALGALILLLQGFVGFTAVLYSWSYVPALVKDHPQRERQYYVNLNLFLGSLFLVPILLQPALTWVAVELTTVLSIFLVAFENTSYAFEAAWKYAVLTIMGATVAAFGIFLLLWGIFHQGGVQTWSAVVVAAPHMAPAVVELAFVFVVLGFGAKIGIVPLHTWLPDAHSQAPTPVCALLSGVEVTTILYVVMRLLPAFTHVPGFPARTWLTVLGLVSLGTASFLLVQVQDVKRLFAFSTVEHMGILFIALGLGPLGDYGAMYHLLTHGITKATAFYAAGTAVLATGTREIGAMRGLVRVSRTAGAGLLLAGLAITGAPPFGVFLSELTILRAAVLRNEWWVLGLVLFFLAIAFAGVMLHVNRMVFGEPSHRPVHTGASLKLALALSAIPVVVLGVYLPQPLQHLFVLAAATLGR